MKFVELDYDISMKICGEVFRLRKKKLLKNLKKEWYKRRPYKRLVDSGGRKLHEGRAFLCSDNKLKNLRLIKNHNKYYIGGIKLKPWINYDCKSCTSWVYGITVPITGCNGNKEEKNIIIRNLMDKEEYLIKKNIN